MQYPAPSFVSKILGIVLLFFLAVYLLKPDHESKALEFIGTGSVLESSYGSLGTSSHFWARIECDPKQVRSFIETHSYPHSIDVLPVRLQDKFNNCAWSWPTNWSEYGEDWVEFEINKGKFVVVAFNKNKEVNEVFYIRWSL